VSMKQIFLRLRGIELIPYSREKTMLDERSTTECPHGGSWAGKDSPVAKFGGKPHSGRAKVGSNACHQCIMNAGTEWDAIRCRVLSTTQRQVDHMARAAGVKS